MAALSPIIDLGNLKMRLIIRVMLKSGPYNRSTISQVQGI